MKRVVIPSLFKVPWLNVFSNFVPNKIISVRDKDANWMTVKIKRVLLEKDLGNKKIVMTTIINFSVIPTLNRRNIGLFYLSSLTSPRSHKSLFPTIWCTLIDTPRQLPPFGYDTDHHLERVAVDPGNPTAWVEFLCACSKLVIKIILDNIVPICLLSKNMEKS